MQLVFKLHSKFYKEIHGFSWQDKKTLSLKSSGSTTYDIILFIFVGLKWIKSNFNKLKIMIKKHCTVEWPLPITWGHKRVLCKVSNNDWFIVTSIKNVSAWILFRGHTQDSI